VIKHLPDTNWLTFLVGAFSLILVLVLKRWLPLVPGSLVAVILGILAVWVFGLDEKGVKIVGHIDSGLPAFGLPTGVGWRDYLSLFGPAIGVLLIGFAEGLGAAKTYATKAGYEVKANRELAGLGAANLGSGLSSGMVVNGSLSKTAVNGGAGAKSQVSGLTVAVLVIITLLFLTGLFESLPEATLAAVVIAAVIELVDIGSLRRLYGVWTARLEQIYGHAARADFAAAIAAMLGVLIFDTLPGLVIGIAVSMLLLIYRSSRPHVARLAKRGEVWLDTDRHLDLPARPDALVVRVESGLMFANSDHVKSQIEALCTEQTKIVVLDAETSPYVDVTAATMLVELRSILTRRGIGFRIARDIGQVRDTLRQTGDAPMLEIDPTIDDALAAYERRAQGSTE
jgi:sulfate permease, SulP family